MQILESIKTMSGSLCQTKYGNKVLNKLQKVYPDLFNSAQTNQNNRQAGSSATNSYSNRVAKVQYKKRSANRKN